MMTKNVRVLAIWALGRIGDARAVSPIFRALSDDHGGAVRLEAEVALSRMNEPGYSSIRQGFIEKNI